MILFVSHTAIASVCRAAHTHILTLNLQPKGYPMLTARFLAIAISLLAAEVTLAQTPAPFKPDPATIQRYGPGYRYPQEGWIVLHIEGSPYERGVQHGRLLAPEIAAFLRCNAAMDGAAQPIRRMETDTRPREQRFSPPL